MFLIINAAYSLYHIFSVQLSYKNHFPDEHMNVLSMNLVRILYVSEDL